MFTSSEAGDLRPIVRATTVGLPETRAERQSLYDCEYPAHVE